MVAAARAKGLDYLEATALKVYCVMAWIPFTLTIFLLAEKIDILTGLIVGMGCLIGAIIGVKLAVWLGSEKIKKIILILVILFSIRIIVK